ncbi:hypothetical protein U3A58_04880 [Algoriphagus sp. C2-6-M1]|uniref:hypothetical protein n=1 Tax=Algoriphagus persicinus TaxID=3108754 RepID=UPI002B36CCD8|nr:hypothetical protein [Algoriphagus sp. C2-6-M1]MEB2779719.1 hypothetical protein [Algoriphagus sp. C2-6-M1]
MRNAFLCLLILNIFSCKSSSSQEPSKEFIKGVYGNPATLLKAGYSFDSLGMNAVFVRSGSLNREIYETSKNQGVKIFVEFATLNGKEYLTDHPDAWPIDEKGEKSPPADWFMGICPTHHGFKEYRSEELKEILDNYTVDGIFLDYVHWHAQFETTEPILPETCFCDRCTETFALSIDTAIPGETIPERAAWILKNIDPQWRKWRVDVLNGWVEDMGGILKSRQPSAKLGVFHCAWYPTDYDSALYRTMGLDPVALAERVDVLAPMLFHHMKGRPTSWVGEYVTWLGQTLEVEKKGSPQIWPIVQSHNNPGIVSPEEFREVMIQGSKFPATGIMMFSDQSLLDDQDKIRVMKELYSKDRPK